MNTKFLTATLSLLTAAILPVLAGPAEDVIAAAKKLESAEGYSWTSTMANAGGGGRFQAGPTHGKVARDGTLHVTMERGENTWEVARRGEKAAVKGQEGWQSTAELEDAQGPGRMFARLAERTRPPAREVQDMVAKIKELRQEGDAYVGNLSEEGARDLMAFGRRGDNAGPSVSGARASIKVWLKDGQLHKYEVKSAGTMSWNGNDRDIDRTTTVEIEKVGATKVELPEAALKKLS